MDYRGKNLLLDLANNGHAAVYVCTNHCNGQIEIVPTVPGTEAAEYATLSLENLVIRSYWEDSELIDTVKRRIRTNIRVMLRNDKSGFNAAEFEAMHRNLSKLDSLDGDDSAMLLPPVPEKTCCARISQPNYVGKLVLIEYPLECKAAEHSGEVIVVAQSDDSLYAVKTESCLTGIYVERIPFTDGYLSIKILSVVEDDEFIQQFIDRLDDMDTDAYDPAACDAAETVSRQLTRMLACKEASKVYVDIETPGLDRLFNAADLFFEKIGRNAGCQNCSCN